MSCEHPEEDVIDYGPPEGGTPTRVEWCPRCGALRHEAQFRDSRDQKYVDWIEWMEPRPARAAADAPTEPPWHAPVSRETYAALAAENAALKARVLELQRELGEHYMVRDRDRALLVQLAAQVERSAGTLERIADRLYAARVLEPGV